MPAGLTSYTLLCEALLSCPHERRVEEPSHGGRS